MARMDLLQGTLDMLILQVLDRGEMHGCGAAQRIHQVSSQVLTVDFGSLYPALFRMQKRGWLESEWRQSEKNRRARFYRLTEAGRKQLAVEKEGWDRMRLAIAQVMQGA